MCRSFTRALARGGIAAVLAAAGVLCGTAFGQLPIPIPTTSTTVTVPSLPAPLPPPPTVTVTLPPPTTSVPLPLPPPTTTVIATPTISTPTVSTPSTSLPATTAATSGGPSSGAGGSSGSSGSATASGTSASGGSSLAPGTWQPSAAARTAGPARRLSALRIRFALPRAAQVLIVLRGPLPSCEVRAQRRIDAKAGANAVRLSKVIRPRRAIPGHYLLTVYAGSVPKVRKVVRIVGDRAQLLGSRAIDEAVALCTARSGAAAAFVDGPDGATAGAPGADIDQPAVQPVAEPVDGSPPAKVLSFLDVESADALNPVLAVLIGMALGALLLAGLGGLAAFVRGRTRSV